MAEKIFQVFISSTYKDLKLERQIVMRSVLELGWIPAGMELFPASDEDQLELIREIIDNSDYYILLVGDRYGSIHPDYNISYTQLEYQYALSKKIPVLAFVRDNLEKLEHSPIETAEPDNKIKLIEFRESLMSSKMCKLWNSPHELDGSITRSLLRLAKKNEGIGWVKGNSFPSADIFQELSNLRKEIARLEGELAKKEEQIENLINSEVRDSQYEVMYLVRDGKKQNFRHHISINWDELLCYILPIIRTGLTPPDLKSRINSFIYSKEHHSLSQQYSYSGLHVEISNEYFYILRDHLIGMGVMEDKNPFITEFYLTEHGISELKRVKNRYVSRDI